MDVKFLAYTEAMQSKPAFILVPFFFLQMSNKTMLPSDFNGTY